MAVIKARSKNYGFWVALFALVGITLKVFGVKLVSNQYDQIVNAILVFLVAAGVVNNPTSGSWYKDKTGEKIAEPEVAEEKTDKE
jgi:uncharacterized membrane protein